METFNFYQDQKHTVWERLRFSVNARTYEEAVEMIRSMKDAPVMESDSIDFSSCETLYDTLELLPLEDNDGCPTLEIFNSKGEEITNNTEE